MCVVRLVSSGLVRENCTDRRFRWSLMVWWSIVAHGSYSHNYMLYYIKCALGRVRNCMGEQALRCETVASSYVCQPNHNYVDFVFRLHSDLTRCHVLAGIQHSAALCLVRTAPPREYPTLLFIGLTCLWPHSFHKIMYLYSINFVWYLLRAVTPWIISQHKCNTNIQDLRQYSSWCTLDYILTLLQLHIVCIE